MGKINNFDIIRLLAAMVVIVHHGYGFAAISGAHEGLVDPLESLVHVIDWGKEGVNIFFVISGYLITKSFIRTPDLLVYFSNRILRIFPGLIAVVLITMFAIGPLFTQLSVHDYFANSATYKYLMNISLIKLVMTLPKVFISHSGAEHVVNAPIWTLAFEFMMYVIVAIYGVAGVLKKDSKRFIIFCAVYAFFFFFSMIKIPKDTFFLKISVNNFPVFYLFFFTGAFIHLFQERIPFRWFYIIPLAVIWYLSIDTFFFSIANLVLTSYVIFYLAFLPYSFGKFITRYGDFSYGMYLYGYLVQNMMMAKTGYTSIFPDTLYCIVLTIPFAMFSWYVIESRAMKLKMRVSKREPLAPATPSA